MFTENCTAEANFFKGTTTSEKLFLLVLRLKKKIEMDGDHFIHLFHVAGTRMIWSGVDGLSRGFITMLECWLARQCFLLFFYPKTLQSVRPACSISFVSGPPLRRKTSWSKYYPSQNGVTLTLVVGLVIWVLLLTAFATQLLSGWDNQSTRDLTLSISCLSHDWLRLFGIGVKKCEKFGKILVGVFHRTYFVLDFFMRKSGSKSKNIDIFKNKN